MKAETVNAETESWWRLQLDDAPLVPFGFAGKLSPHAASVTLISAPKPTVLTISLEANNATGIRMRGTWGAPTPTKGDPNEYGHDGHGHIDDLPPELVQTILAACGGITIPTKERQS